MSTAVSHASDADVEDLSPGSQCALSWQGVEQRQGTGGFSQSRLYWGT